MSYRVSLYHTAGVAAMKQRGIVATTVLAVSRCQMATLATDIVHALLAITATLRGDGNVETTRGV